jgi:hypothetical protein
MLVHCTREGELFDAHAARLDTPQPADGGLRVMAQPRPDYEGTFPTPLSPQPQSPGSTLVAASAFLAHSKRHLVAAIASQQSLDSGSMPLQRGAAPNARHTII